MDNTALTKDDLREMHGDPIWLRNEYGNGYWYIVDAVCECLVGITLFKEDKNDNRPTINDFSLLDDGSWTAHKEPIDGDWHLNPFPYRDLNKNQME